MTRKTYPQRLAAAVGALTIAMAGFAGVANAALGTPGTPPGEAAAGTTGQLTIHKRVGTQGATGNGTAIENAPGTALGGVGFTVQRIGTWKSGVCTPIDLTTTAGWEAAQQANGSPATPPVALADEDKLCVAETKPEQFTSAAPDGKTTFIDLALGLYYVTESTTPSDIVEKAVPFYVTIPFNSVGANNVKTWLYDVHVYPKNSKAEAPTKTIAGSPSALVVGSTVTWTISQTIPTLAAAGSVFTEASVTDVLNSRLTYVSSTVKIGDTPVEHNFTNSPEGNLKWDIVGTGLTALKENPGATLSVEVVTTVNAVGDGIIPNDSAQVSFNDKPQDPPTVPYTYWGKLEVTKQDKSDNTKKLSGAQFAIFAKTGDSCPTTMPTTGTVATGETNATGVVQWNSVTPASPLGLWIANSNTELAPTAQVKDYCLYETKAPAGYVKITTPWTITITTANDALVTLAIDNDKTPGPDLPLTGAQGTMIFTIVGGLVVITAGGLMLRRTRKVNS